VHKAPKGDMTFAILCIDTPFVPAKVGRDICQNNKTRPDFAHKIRIIVQQSIALKHQIVKCGIAFGKIDIANKCCVTSLITTSIIVQLTGHRICKFGVALRDDGSEKSSVWRAPSVAKY
jgi:hypothetical protein